MTGPPRTCGISGCSGRAIGFVLSAETYVCHQCAAIAAGHELIVLAYRTDTEVMPL